MASFAIDPKPVEATPDITSNLTFHYDFENSGALGNDISAANNDATVGTGVAAQVDGTRGDVAKFTKASAQNYIVTPVNNPTTSYTQSAWVYITDAAGNQSIFGTGTTSSGNLAYFYVKPTRVVFASNKFGTETSDTLGTISNSTWYHLVKVYDSSTGILSTYVNGVLWRYSDVSAPAANRVILGSHAQSTTPSGTSTLSLGGYLDDVRQYSRALTQEDIQSLYFTESGTVSTPQNLKAYGIDSSVSLVWDEMAATDFIIEYKLSADSSWTTFADGTDTTSGTIVTGLTNGLAYDFRVSSTDGVTTSSASSTDSATPKAVGLWVPVFVHNSSSDAVFSSATRWTEAKSTNETSATPLTEQKFSTFAHVENFRDAGDSDKLTFKLMYPDLHATRANIWKQTNNPANDAADANNGVTGYSEIQTHFNLIGSDFFGLEYNGTAGLADGGIAGNSWFILGTSSLAYDGTNGFAPDDFRGPQDVGVQQVQLYVKNPFYTGVPEKVLNLKVIPGNSQAYLTWKSVIALPVVTDYKIEYKLSSSGSWLTFADGTSTDIDATITGLTNTSSYDFRVSAVNASGDGVVSDTATRTIGTQTFYHILSNGQSLSLGSTGTPPLSVEQPYENFMLYGDPGFTNNAGPVGSELPLVPLIETFEYLDEGLIESPSSGMLNTLAAYDDPVTPSRRFVMGLHGMGGSAYSVIKKGGTGGAGNGYGRGQTQATNTKDAVEDTFAGIYQPLAVTLIHGESDAALGNGTGNPSAYEGYLTEMQNDYETDLNALTGNSDHIPLFYSQQNSSFPHLLAVAQLRAHRTYDDDMYLIGPTYQYPFNADEVHLQRQSYRQLGEQFAKVMDKVLFEAEDWDPLMPKVVARNGSSVFVWFHVPVEPLVLDTTLVVQRTDGKYGFQFIQTGGSTTLSTVALASDNVVELTLSGAPDGTTPRIKYAAQVFGSSAEGDPTEASKSGGNLRDSDDSVSPASDSSGEPLYNWGVSFDENITTDSNSPVVTITAPTKSSGSTITDTTIQVTDDVAVIAEDVVVGGSTTATTSAFVCTQTSNTQVDCTISISASGDLVINATDLVERTGTDTEAGYSIVADVTAPTITNVTSDKTNGSYTVGEVIDIDVTFSENVTSTGNVTVTLETGATDRTCTFTVSSASSGTCNYTVQSGDTSSDLTVGSISGTIADAALNAMSNFVPATNLAANKALVIDTTNPSVSTLSPLDNATGVSTTANLVMTFDAAVDVETGNITIKKTSDDSTIETINVAGAFVTGTGTSTITINPSVTLVGSTGYYVLVDATAFDDAAGNSYAGIASTTAWSFTTADATAPTVTITAPTKTSNATITDTTIEVTDDLGVLVADVSVGAGSTAGTASLSCAQTSGTEVDCTISITSSGNLIIEAEDGTANLGSDTETSYVIDTTDPVVTITAPTTSSTGTITDTTIEVTDNVAVSTSDVIVGAGSSAGTASLSCAQTSATEVDCTISITSSGDLVIEADDSVGNSGSDTELGYSIVAADSSEGGSSTGTTARARAVNTQNENRAPSPTPTNDDEKECTALTISARLVRMGDTGADVKKIQTFLLSQGYAIGTADGIFGQMTKNAIIDFQNKNGLDVDGIVGPASVAKMSTCAGAAAVPSAPTALLASCDFTPAKKGDNGAHVKLIQNFLSSQKYNVGVADGIFGNLTETATKDFQLFWRKDILDPLGITNPTGWFYGNTIKKAKELCL